VRKIGIGATGITVTELCHGTLILGPLQANLTPQQGAAAIRKSHDLGVNFYDTAQGYHTYPHLALGLQGIPESSVVIASKSHAASREQMRADVEECLRALGRSYVDVFHLHLVSSGQNLEDRRGALECLVEMRKRGTVRAIGGSTHTIAGVQALNGEPAFDVVFPVLNQRGLGIIDGELPQMLEALEETKRLGKFVYAMKPLGGGHLASEVEASFNYLRNLPVCDAVAAGMKDEAEVEMNVAVFEDRPIPADVGRRVGSVPRRLIIYDRCVSCGLCIEECDQKALALGKTKVEVDQSRCILCGYCAAVCPEYVIRVI
jgi:aryl-alcohol dehydrogenase-like predicted oxidoreductase/NAD-dependent dihydropyrimidine dehydrogenase PreA subunit